MRAVNDLTHGDVGAALSSNLLVTVGIPVVAVLLALWLVRAWRGVAPRPLPAPVRSYGWGVFAIVLLCFAVLRNTPWGNWLAPV